MILHVYACVYKHMYVDDYTTIPFGCMMEFQFLAQFPVGHLSHSVMTGCMC